MARVPRIAPSCPARSFSLLALQEKPQTVLDLLPCMKQPSLDRILGTALDRSDLSERQPLVEHQVQAFAMFLGELAHAPLHAFAPLLLGQQFERARVIRRQLFIELV